MVCTQRSVGICIRGAFQCDRIHIGNPVQRLGRVEHLLERPLLIWGTPKQRVASEVGRVTHRWIQPLVADQLDPWLESLDQFAVLLRKRCRHYHA